MSDIRETRGRKHIFICIGFMCNIGVFFSSDGKLIECAVILSAVKVSYEWTARMLCHFAYTNFYSTTEIVD